MFDTIFTATVVLLSLDHLITGLLGALCPQRASKMYALFFGASVPQDERLEIFFKPWGALGFFAGIVGMFTAFEPERYKIIVFSLFILLLLRIWIRSHMSKKATEYVHLSSKRNFIHIAIIATCAAIIGIKLIQLW